ncbi:HD domain-containing protein [Streptacidiphilus sp. P02-A3a]|uniref:HD domain-containing protein n=1 Tax=Streptacidiphilus sp. P02-A3a TaxID=2704468 RepID=UPI0015FDC167|nr:HD domain-containing protein [Streptacidiphilus sp. P02-A3a]QMU70693.1 bifunctional (p)ppGpp synthetase/guanosine-3',5'-bis(diphosphate) 3'-pyrophosphohydrolase [Streptacidiphilus sp. P02-A3a]
MPRTLTLADVDALAAEAHAGQVDRIGVPYVEHVRAVARGLAPFGAGLQMAGLLHDVLEDTGTTAPALLAAGVPPTVVDIVQRVTNRPGVPYRDMLRSAAEHYAACLLKISDNADNSDPSRTAQLPPDTAERLAAKYAQARTVLWPAVPYEDTAAVLRIVNPTLLTELGSVHGRSE